VLTYGTMVHVAEAAVRLAGVDAEIVDVRTMAPLDVDTLCTSVCKTGRCVVCTKRRASAAMALSSWPRFRNSASGTWKRRCCALPAGTLLIHTPSNGSIFQTGAHCRGAEAGDGGGVSRYVFKLPDLGEGTVEAEIVNWRVKPGDTVPRTRCSSR